MKLSEILGWKKKDPEREDTCSVQFAIVFNAALDACDREIDREALIRELKNHTYFATCEQVADLIISTMPTWLKPTERK